MIPLGSCIAFNCHTSVVFNLAQLFSLSLFVKTVTLKIPVKKDLAPKRNFQAMLKLRVWYKLSFELLLYSSALCFLGLLPYFNVIALAFSTQDLCGLLYFNLAQLPGKKTLLNLF